MFTFFRSSQRERRPAAAPAPAAAEQEREEEQSSGRDETARRLALQGAVQALPSESPNAGAQEAEAGQRTENASGGSGQSAEEPPYEDLHEFLRLEELSKAVKEARKYGIEPYMPESVRKRLEAHMNGTIPFAKWYRKRAKEYLKEEKERAKIEEKWSHPTRERAGRRERDLNMEEDVRTNIHMHRMNPGLFDVKQRWRNFKENKHKARAVISLTPVIGAGVAHYSTAKENRQARDVLLGMSQVQTDERLAEQNKRQAQALDKVNTAGWIKAGISGTVGVASYFLSPVPGVGVVVNKGAGALVDKAYSQSNETVREMRARMRARQDMSQSEFEPYQDEMEFILLEKLAEQFRKGGQGDEDSGMMSELGPDLQRRLMAHIMGMIPDREEMEKRAKALLEERENQFKAGLEPRPAENTGLLAKFKGWFSRSRNTG